MAASSAPPGGFPLRPYSNPPRVAADAILLEGGAHLDRRARPRRSRIGLRAGVDGQRLEVVSHAVRRGARMSGSRPAGRATPRARPPPGPIDGQRPVQRTPGVARQARRRMRRTRKPFTGCERPRWPGRRPPRGQHEGPIGCMPNMTAAAIVSPARRSLPARRGDEQHRPPRRATVAEGAARRRTSASRRTSAIVARKTWTRGPAT